MELHGIHREAFDLMQLIVLDRHRDDIPVPHFIEGCGLRAPRADAYDTVYDFEHPEIVAKAEGIKIKPQGSDVVFLKLVDQLLVVIPVKIEIDVEKPDMKSVS
jgi:hypothetical protein